jgi:hypothetical protein
MRTSKADLGVEPPVSPPLPRKKSGGTVWVFLAILLLGGGAAVALALNPALLDRLNALVEGSAARSDVAADLGVGDTDAGPLDGTARDAGVFAVPVEPNSGLLEDAGLDEDVAGGEDAGIVEDAGADEEPGLDAGAPDDEQVRPTKRVVRRHPARRPVRRPARRPARRR